MFPTRRFYITATAVILVIAGGYVYPPLYSVGLILLAVMGVLTTAEAALLWSRRGMEAWRNCSDRFSNGDDNEVRLRVESTYGFGVMAEVIDEIPAVFQRRDIRFPLKLKPGQGKTVTYTLRPTARGVYGFGRIRVFASTDVGLLQRRFTCGRPEDIKVYPSYLMLHRYELLAISNRLTDMGVKRIRRAGHSTEFEQIKDYVKGDDYRMINWKATARQHRLMVNVCQDERSQQVVAVIDKGRVMQQSFLGMSLLDYSINAALVLSYVAIHKGDKAGLVTFCEEFCGNIPPSRRPGQMQRMQESLYALETTFGESDFYSLVTGMNTHLPKRSLLVLFTNFAGKASMERQLPYLRQLNGRHRLLVVFFEDREVRDYAAGKAANTEEYYRHVIAARCVAEQRMTVSALRRNGIMSLLTTPENLSINVINKYLDIKSSLSI